MFNHWLFQRLKKKPLFFTLSYLLTVPVATLCILHSRKIRPEYRLSILRRFWLGARMFWNTARIPSGSSYKAHLAMALKLFEMPPPLLLPGDVVECGTWKGASAANLSLACKIVGRRLIIYDSFEGLPQPLMGTPDSELYRKGDYSGTLDEVKANIQKYGAIEVCEFVKGWFQDSLPKSSEPVVLAWIDVDLEDSLETCVLNLWPRLHNTGYMFLDECAGVQYVALFYSERWWRTRFNTLPPGFIGAGTGLCLGNYYIGPFDDISDHPLQHAGTAGYTGKMLSGYWSGPADRRA